MMEILLFTLLFALIHPKTVVTNQILSGACRENREEFGFALVGHYYRSVHADHVGRCLFECSLTEKCQSVTYLCDKKECKMNKETKRSRPEDYMENPAATYVENIFRAKKGSQSSIPGHSCKDILMSGDAQGDTEYWIDPTASGDPFRVFCDMTTDEGGWTLIKQFIMRNQSEGDDETSNSYREILPNYNSNNKFLLRSGFYQLRNDMGFIQIRFYCFKKILDRVFHIMTNKNAEGEKVVKFFTNSTSSDRPKACGSFIPLPDDNSILAVNCQKWGYENKDNWGRVGYLNNQRLYQRSILWLSAERFYKCYGRLPHKCDDDDSPMSLGDTWQIFVR